MTIVALFLPWYLITANVIVPPSEQTGTFNVLSVDGINGVQIRLPNRDGPVPLGTFAVPFYLIIFMSMVFLVLSTIGISQSKKLGKKYVPKGIRLLVPFILILIFILFVATILPMIAPSNLGGTTEMSQAIDAISASPFNGQYNVPITEVAGGSIRMTWGFGMGAYLLLIAGILLIMAGVMEITAHAQFFEENTPAQLSTEEKNTEKIK